MALGMGADVTVLDKNVDVLSRLARQFGPALKTLYFSRMALEASVVDADLVVGAVLVVGAEAPKLVTAEMVRCMRPGSVLVDVAIDQGGCFETSRPTTHADPTYVVDGVVHYCVANMPGAVPRTSTYALNNVTLPYALALADRGPRKALLDNPNFREGLNVCQGKVTYRAVASELGYEFVEPVKALAACLTTKRKHNGVS
jgi:alanine dehydrogenase